MFGPLARLLRTVAEMEAAQTAKFDVPAVESAESAGGAAEDLAEPPPLMACAVAMFVCSLLFARRARQDLEQISRVLTCQIRHKLRRPLSEARGQTRQARTLARQQD
jgi:hypothetical protein